jgi:hypothetical protein
LEPRGARLPHHGRAGQEARAAAFFVDSKIGSNNHVEERLDRPGQRPHNTGDKNRGVAGGTVLPNPANSLGGKPAQDVRSHRRVDETLQRGEIGTAIAAIDRSQEGAAISLLSAQVRREVPNHLPHFGQLLRARELRQSSPKVLLDDVGRHDRAVQVEDRERRWAGGVLVEIFHRGWAVAALASDRVHPAYGCGDRWTVHFLDICLPVEDRGIEGKCSLIIRMQRPGEGEVLSSTKCSSDCAYSL